MRGTYCKPKADFYTLSRHRNISIILESGFWPPGEWKPNIHLPFSSVVGLHQLMREMSSSFAAAVVGNQVVEQVESEPKKKVSQLEKIG